MNPHPPTHLVKHCRLFLYFCAAPCHLQLRTIPSSAHTPGQTPSLPLFVPDGSTVRSVTVPFPQCLMRDVHNSGFCVGPSNVTSASTFYATTACGSQLYSTAADHNVIIEVSRICFRDFVGMSADPAATVLLPRAGVCSGSGPPLTLYLRTDVFSDQAFLLPNGMPYWADAYSPRTIVVSLGRNDSTLRVAIPPSLCAGSHPTSKCKE
jgi:hypothetical protein